jgi:outer membrane protein assembly factor BamB
MRNVLLKKGLVFGMLLLFVTASFGSTLNANPSQNSTSVQRINWLNGNVVSEDISNQRLSGKNNRRPVFINSFDESATVLILLDINGVSYGQELLWKANTTGTNYEESAVVYCDGTAYISSCSTHGDGHDKLFAVDTTNGDILWSVFIGPGYVGPVIDNDRIYIGSSSHGYDPTNEYVFCINRSDGKVLWSRNIYGGIAESEQ